ncbi:HBR217Cp [Eremothecium sinecaudum]|uniref:HBR217Cp n=1 Tax=Eremothecium sinecaudum TaxID=45286 RepID=A0A109UX68_9SACH|nr:HBR217Cp [Eremothecium sinecaudum]AMD19118.1 HBR217Cp [Eremothecium sinecaudum]
MPNVSNRPLTYKKPTLEDVDPISNYIPAAVRDKISNDAYEILKKLRKFIDIECLSKEAEYRRELMECNYDIENCLIVQKLRERAKALNLNMLYVLMQQFENQDPFYGNRLTLLEYCFLSFFLGKSLLAQAVMHTDSSMVNVGTMEILLRYGSPEQLANYLYPIVSQNLNASFMVSEREVSSSDALNVTTTCTINEESGTMKINGSKWFASSLEDPSCHLWLILCLTENEEGNIYKRHSVIIIDREDMKTEGISFKLIEMGGPNATADNNKYYEVHFKDVVVPFKVLGARGEGFSMVQTRSSIAKLYQCMKLCGMGQEALRQAQIRASNRKVFGSKLQKTETFKTEVAKWKIKIETCKIVCCNAAVKCQVEGVKQARDDIAMAKILTPREMTSLIDWSIQVHGSLGLCSAETSLVKMWQACRTSRINEGPDEALLSQLGKLELSNFAKNQKTWDDELSKVKSS